MRKLIILAAFLALVVPGVLLGDTINLNAPVTGTITITPSGSGNIASMTFSSMSWTSTGEGSVLGGTSGDSFLTGSGSESGTLAFDSETGGSEVYDLTQSGSLNYCYSSSTSSCTSPFLTGSVNFTGLTTSDGIHYSLGGTLTGLGGSDANSFGSGTLSFFIDFTGGSDLSDVTSITPLTFSNSTGEVTVPEPRTASLLSAGLGLVALAAL